MAEQLSPASPRSIRWTVTLAASLGWFFDAYVITIYALTIPLIAAEFHLTTNILSGAIGSIFLLGYTIGTIGFGVCGDQFGRRVMLGISVVGYGVVTALTALTSGIGSPSSPERAETIHHEDHGRVPMTISVFASRLYETFHLIADHILSADTNCLAHVRFLGRFWQLSAFLRLGLVLI